ncbi:MAG: GntR family transcriptional regulator [Candidatus Cloacimonadota bacterium]|nr:MAG: GntR family transcriptional regulator [Candidatus Cloacimonadota bacterium]
MKIRIDPMSNIPIYKQIIEHFSHLILSGQLNANDKLPSSRALGVEIKVNMLTVQKAYQELRALGLIYNKRGEGSFVAEVESNINFDLQIEKIQKQFQQTIEIALMYELSKEKILQVFSETLKV